MSPERPMRRGFGSRVLWLSGGSASSLALLLVFVPLIARQTDPTTYGLYALIAAGVSVASGLYTLRLELSIPACRTRLQALESAVLATASLIALSVVTTCVLVFSSPWWPGHLYPGTTLLIAAGLAAVLFGTHQVGRYWATRLGLERRSALAQTLRTAVMLAAQLALLALGWGALGLVLGQALGSLLAVGFLAPLYPWRRIARLSLPRLRRRLSDNRDYVRFSTPSMVLSLAGSHLPVYLLASFFGLSVSGSFALVVRVLGAPAGLVSQAIGMVLLSDVSKSVHSDRRIDDVVREIANGLVPVALAIYIGVAIFADPLLVWVLGGEWTDAAPVAAALSPWFAVAFLVTALQGLPLALGRQKTLFAFTAGGTLVRLGVLAAAGLAGSRALALWGYGAAGAVTGLFTLVWFLRLASVPREWEVRLGIRSAAEASLLGAVFWGLERAHLVLGTAAAVALGLALAIVRLRKLVLR